MSSIPGWLSVLVDDAAVFPPGNAPLGRAVAEHAGHREDRHADLVGGFVVTDRALPEADRLARDAGYSAQVPLSVNVVVTGGAGGLEPAVVWADRAEALQLRVVETALRDLDDLAGAARRVVTAADSLPQLDQAEAPVPIYVEVPVDPEAPGVAAALDVLAERELRVKLRTGGLDATAYPSPGALAGSIDAALDRELPFKCTAGLHHAVAREEPESGAAQHGFLNVLLATRAALDGEGRENVTAVLAERSADTLLDRLAKIDAAALERTRRWFTAFGSCSVTEPCDDLVALGLLD